MSVIADKTRILITWTEVTGYALACWRALAARDDVEIRVVAGSPGTADTLNSFGSFREEPWLVLLTPPNLANVAYVRQIAQRFAPAVVVVAGWRNPAFTQLAALKARTGWRTVMALDSSFERPVRQLLGRLRLAALLRHVDAFLVPGERGREFLHRWWRVSNARIRTGLYGVDMGLWSAAQSKRADNPPWPRSFQFLGRYIPLKGVPELLAGYRGYREQVEDPIPLRCCGGGPLASEVQASPGVTDLGYVQPAALGDIFAKAGCFILPSRYDPWPIALVEACAAGLPVIAGVGCGSAVEVVRDGFNGNLLRDSCSDSVAGALLSMHERYPAWPTMGGRSASLAQPYAAEQWADNLARLAHGLTEGVQQADYCVTVNTPAPDESIGRGL